MDKLDKKGFDNYYKLVLNKLEQFVRQVMEKMQADTVNIIEREGKEAWGRLKAGIDYEIMKEAARLVGVFGVRANVKYGIYVHEGTRPHFPPVDAIQKWVVQKGLMKTGKRPSTLRAMKKSGSSQLQDSRQIAFLIARKISRQGTKGLAFLKMALNQNVGFIAQKLAALKV